MIEDLTIRYVCNGIETTLTIKDEHYDNMPYNLADIFAKVIRESDVNAIGGIYESEEKAKKAAFWSSCPFTTIKIEWEE